MVGERRRFERNDEIRRSIVRPITPTNVVPETNSLRQQRGLQQPDQRRAKSVHAISWIYFLLCCTDEWKHRKYAFEVTSRDIVAIPDRPFQ